MKGIGGEEQKIRGIGERYREVGKEKDELVKVIDGVEYGD